MRITLDKGHAIITAMTYKGINCKYYRGNVAIYENNQFLWSVTVDIDRPYKFEALKDAQLKLKEFTDINV